MECCSCRAADQPTLVCLDCGDPAQCWHPQPGESSVETNPGSPHSDGMPENTPNKEKWRHLNALCNIRPITTRKLQVVLYARRQTNLIKTTRFFPVAELLAREVIFGFSDGDLSSASSQFPMFQSDANDGSFRLICITASASCSQTASGDTQTQEPNRNSDSFIEWC